MADRPTYRIEEVSENSDDDEDNSELIDVFPPASPPPPPRPFSSSSDDDTSEGAQKSLSDLAKQIQTSSSSNKNKSGGSPTSAGSSSTTTLKPAMKQPTNAATTTTTTHSVGFPGENAGSSGSLRSNSSATLSERLDRRQFLKTVHSGRSLHSDVSSNHETDADPNKTNRLNAENASPMNSPTNSMRKSSADRRSQWNRTAGTVRAPHSSPQSSRSSLGTSSSSTTNFSRPPPSLERMATSGGTKFNTKRANLIASRLASRSAAVKTRLTSNDRKTGDAGEELPGDAHYTPGAADPYNLNANIRRRYKPGDHVLVCNQQSRWSTLVNRYGFPPGEGATPEEMRGPYIYSLATVKQVHFEEFAAYYTVTRADTGGDQRADADFMEPLRSLRGEQAAYRAAMQSSLDQNQTTPPLGGQSPNHNMTYNPNAYNNDQDPFVMREISDSNGSPRHKVWQCLESTCFLLLLPFLCIYDHLLLCASRCLAPIGRFLQRQARLVLMGLAPYACQLRLTMVNFIVVCSFWYMFIDQARLVFFSAKSDNAIAIVNLLVWLILLLELIVEVFIRPDGYKNLILSEKAFSPQTVRYINALHLGVELLSLALFVPEFYCIFSSKDSCSERLTFSFLNAAFLAVTGPTRREAVYGRAYFALVRLRIFGLVRHWKKMWITNTFLVGKRSSAERGFLSSIFPQRPKNIKTNKRQDVPQTEPESKLSSDGNEGKTNRGRGGSNETSKEYDDSDIEDSLVEADDSKDAALVNASNIGTALMVTNSYRAISLLWVITGLFPIFTFAIDSRLINDISYTMTKQLQGTNMIANDTSDSSCRFLAESTYSWIGAVVAPDIDEDFSDPYLVTLEVLPERCGVSHLMCQNFTDLTGFAKSLCDVRARIANQTREQMADTLGVRVGALAEYDQSNFGTLFFVENGTEVNTTFTTRSIFDQSYSIATSAFGCLLLQLSLIFLVLGGLTILRRDAEVLVLGPLRRMLKIVARYAKNPLVQPKLGRMRSGSRRKLSQRAVSRDDSFSSTSSSDMSDYDENGDAWRNDQFALGSYETEQLIAAVTKITDLLRKCWGVAGADIISTNLATREGALTEIFNPTVPGKSVYALFAFAAINDFDHALRNLSGDVMILINDVAAVLHGEVFRWGFGDSGQCNKNLGGAFLMVFRIGLVKEVIKKLEQATDVIFSGSKGSQSKASQALTRRRAHKIQQQQHQPSLSAMMSSPPARRRSSNTVHSQGSGSSTVAGGSSDSSRNATQGRQAPRSEGFAATRIANQSYRRLLKVQRSASVKAMSLSLASLPGISTFTDRAVIGMLKSFASIHRDNKLRSWNNDFRLGAGVGAFTVSMIYGMDAGWAVEGAVGSSYKIDATYLSPHVNMASRMMSACKQYGVSILLSQAVQELMSDVACSKLRHLDTVTVKGSSIKQKIYTYDARHQGADFFLYSRMDDQADIEADQYTPNIWNKDADLNAMRQHVTEEFLKEFNEGRKLFLLGEWSAAKRRLEKANELMVENAIESGYLEAELEEIMNQAANPTEAAEELKRQNGDGPSQYLLNFMKSYGGAPPPVWEGWHPLTRK